MHKPITCNNKARIQIFPCTVMPTQVPWPVGWQGNSFMEITQLENCSFLLIQHTLTLLNFPWGVSSLLGHEAYVDLGF